MPLRYRILSNPESVQDLVIASSERYWEGAELLVAGRRSAGIYLLGYTAEMLLKAACFYVDGARPYHLVQPRLAPLRNWARRCLPGVPYESYHSLWFWAQIVRARRAWYGRNLPSTVEATLMQRVRRLYGIWVVNMRYKPDEALAREAELVLEDVTWLRDRQNQLVY